MANKVYIGIDVGKKGGIAVKSPRQSELMLMTIPRIKDKVDLRALVELFEDILMEGDEFMVAIEDVHSLFGMSAKSNFSFGEIKGIKIGILNALGFPYELVPPKTWQKEIWTSADMVYKTGKKVDTKATALVAAKRLFPNESFLATSRSSVPHDGLVDAALILEYCERKFK